MVQPPILQHCILLVFLYCLMLFPPAKTKGRTYNYSPMSYIFLNRLQTLHNTFRSKKLVECVTYKMKYSVFVTKNKIQYGHYTFHITGKEIMCRNTITILYFRSQNLKITFLQLKQYSIQTSIQNK